MGKSSACRVNRLPAQRRPVRGEPVPSLLAAQGCLVPLFSEPDKTTAVVSRCSFDPSCPPTTPPPSPRHGCCLTVPRHVSMRSKHGEQPDGPPNGNVRSLAGYFLYCRCCWCGADRCPLVPPCGWSKPPGTPGCRGPRLDGGPGVRLAVARPSRGEIARARSRKAEEGQKLSMRGSLLPGHRASQASPSRS